MAGVIARSSLHISSEPALPVANSAACYDCIEDIGILAVVVPIRELSQIQYEQEDALRALRAENARLRGLLAEIQYDCEHIGGIQHLDKAERRTWVSVANRIKAALQPKEPNHE